MTAPQLASWISEAARTYQIIYSCQSLSRIALKYQIGAPALRRWQDADKSGSPADQRAPRGLGVRVMGPSWLPEAVSGRAQELLGGLVIEVERSAGLG